MLIVIEPFKDDLNGDVDFLERRLLEAVFFRWIYQRAAFIRGNMVRL